MMNAHHAALGISAESIAARGLRAYTEAGHLEVAEIGVDGREHRLVAAAAAAWQGMRAAAQREGVSIYIVSAFRSVERQAEIVREKLEAGMTIEEVFTICAPPGFSEHHSGRAVDISTPCVRALDVAFDQSKAFVWLMANAHGFGFYMSYPVGNPHGYQYEPWHWCHHEI